MDQQILAKISEQFKQLQSPLYLLDEHGICLVPRDGGHYHLSETLYPGEMTRLHGMHYLRLPRHNVIVAAPDSTSEDLIRMGAAMVDALLTLCDSSGGTGGAYRGAGRRRQRIPYRCRCTPLHSSAAHDSGAGTYRARYSV